MITEAQKKCLDLYNEGLGLYKQRKWTEAIAKFQQALESVPGDGPSQLYIDRSNQYMKNPPGPDWDGVFVMTTK